MFEYVNQGNAHIKVFGVGGGGSNAVDCMIADGIGMDGITFICANTDAQALQRSAAPIKLQIGTGITAGLGAGANPEVGERSALEDQDRIREVLDGADMVFITAGMGGGTGTGAAPVVAQIAKDLGILTVAVVTKPLKIEGRKRMLSADRGIQELRNHVDSLIEIPNQRLLGQSERGMGLQQTFAIANKILIDAVKGITEIINDNGIINVDFADVRTIMSNQGSPSALMGTGIGRGDKRAISAAAAAISSPLLDHDITSARALLMNFTGGLSMSLDEIHDAADTITREIQGEPQVILGAVVDESGAFDDETIKVTVIATGFTELLAHEDFEQGSNFDVGQASSPYSGRTRSYRPMSRQDRYSSMPVQQAARGPYEGSSYHSSSISNAPPVHRDSNSSSSDEHPAWQLDDHQSQSEIKQSSSQSSANRMPERSQDSRSYSVQDRRNRPSAPQRHISSPPENRDGDNHQFRPYAQRESMRGQASNRGDYLGANRSSNPYGDEATPSPSAASSRREYQAPERAARPARPARSSSRAQLSSLMPVAPMGSHEDQWGSEEDTRDTRSRQAKQSGDRGHGNKENEVGNTQDYDSVGYASNGLKVYRS